MSKILSKIGFKKKLLERKIGEKGKIGSALVLAITWAAVKFGLNATSFAVKFLFSM